MTYNSISNISPPIKFHYSTKKSEKAVHFKFENLAVFSGEISNHTCNAVVGSIYTTPLKN